MIWQKLVVFGLLALAPAAAVALEHSAPDDPQAAPADLHNSMLKPRYLFNMRGRRDPFINVTRLATAGSAGLVISSLQFKGVIGVEGATAALFVSVNDRALYTLRGNRLYGSGEKAVPGVSGRMLSDREVRLRQGELVLNFSAIRAAKRKI